MYTSSPVTGKSQSPILLKDLKSFILKSQIPNLMAQIPNPKSKLQIPIWKLKIQTKSRIPIFPRVHKHELRSLQHRTKLAIHQCHCQCYSIKCLKCLRELLDSIFTSVVVVYHCCLQLKPVNSAGETTKHQKGQMSNNRQWFDCRISRPKVNCKK